ncbi:hypothetical protein C8R45DRAFT_993776 [Mycena sanguinolenta]|nr:hypothetical protein C8R45DRAFT_993776 [Mycena sanguinolenta]
MEPPCTTLARLAGKYKMPIIPTELIYAIIDQLHLPSTLELEDWTGQRTYSESRRTLRSCALVSRSFVRPSQMRLFSLIFLRVEDTKYTRSLSAILSSSPHLGGYIRTLHLLAPEPSQPVLDIIYASKALDTLILQSDYHYLYRPFKFDCAIPLLSRLPTLRCFQLIRYWFRNARELESLLKTSTSLRELKLKHVRFSGEEESDLEVQNDHVPFEHLNGDSSSSVLALATLNLVAISSATLDSMLKYFTMVDIKHLKSLTLSDCPMTSLVRLNADSLRHLTIDIPVVFHHSDASRIRSDILACANGLSILTLKARLVWVLSTLPAFGNLRDLSALKTIRIVLWDFVTAPQPWAQLDGLLAQTRIAEVELYAGNAATIASVENWLPSLSSSGRLQVFSNAGRLKEV